MRIETGHREELCTDYQRDLDLNEAVSHVTYTYQGVQYQREYLCSYPDHMLAVLFTALQPGSVSFRLNGHIPYPRPFGEEGRFVIQNQGGSLTAGPDWIEVTGADRAVLLGCVGTNYQMEESVFLESDPEKKLAGFPHPHEKVRRWLNAARKKSWEELKQTHTEDYKTYFDRVSLDLGETGAGLLPTDQRLENYKKGLADPGLEALYFQYGRYLLIASSRKGALPGNLQGGVEPVWGDSVECRILA